MSWEIRRYNREDKEIWNEFIKNSRNGTFLFNRDYMDYHADRFVDFSLMVYKNGKLRAVLPANISQEEIHSHQGLTYGGWVLPEGHIDGADLLSLFDEMIAFCKIERIKKIYYKPVPTIYHKIPSQEDLYALFAKGGEVVETNLSSSIEIASNPGFNTLMRRHLKKVSDREFVVRETNDVETFMRNVENCLKDRHDAVPVHSGAEMRLLKERFPSNIQFYQIELDGSVDAAGGVCIYLDNQVAHCQYIWTTERGREENLLPMLFRELIEERFSGCKYFDLGTSNEDHGRRLNEGLLRQKFSMGATGVVYSCYMIEI